MVLPLPPGGPPLPPELLALLGGGPAPFGPPPPPAFGPPPAPPFLGPRPPDQAEPAYGQNPTTKKKPRRPKPTEIWIKEQADRLVSFWGPRDQRMDQEYKLYSLARDQYTGTGELVVLNLPYVVIEKGATLLGKQVPNLDVVPPRNELREPAQQIEDFLRYVWSRWDDIYADALHNSLRRSLAHYLLLRGWTALRISYDADAGDSGDPYALPVKLKPYDPRQIYPMVGDGGLQYVVHRYRTTVGELIDEWPEADKLFKGRGGLQQDPLESLEVTAYYDDWYHCVYCDQGVIKPPTAHEYGFVPWRVGVAYGSDVGATANDQSGWVRNVGLSLLSGFADMYRQLNKVMSQMATEVARAAKPPLLYFYDPSNPEEPQPLKYESGAVNYLVYDRERVEPLHLTPSPGSAGPLMDALRQGIDMAALPAQIFGIMPPGASGYAQTLMAEAAEDQLFPGITALARIIRTASEQALEIIRDLHDGPVGYYVKDRNSGQWTGGLTIDPELIAEVGCRVQVNFRQVSPRDKAMMANLAKLLTEAKLISLETARDEYLELENPGRENERVLTDLVYLDQEVVKGLREVALRRSDPELAEAVALGRQLAQQEAAMQTPPPPGPPGLPPPGLPPGMGPPPGGPPGLPPQLVPPIEQSMAADPLAGLLQSLGSAAGGASAGPLPPSPGGLPFIPGLS